MACCPKCTYDYETDAAIDIHYPTRNVAVSWCDFSEYDKTMFMKSNGVNVQGWEYGGTLDHDKIIPFVVMHNNRFSGNESRNPSIAGYCVHVLNNYYYDTGKQAIQIKGNESQCYLDRNHFERIRSPVVCARDHDDIMAPAFPCFQNGHTTDLSPGSYLYDHNTYIDIDGEANDNIGPGGAEWQYCSLLPVTSYYDMLFNPLFFNKGVALENYLHFRLESEDVKNVVNEECGPVKYLSDLY